MKTLKNAQEKEAKAKEEETDSSKVQIMCMSYVTGFEKTLRMGSACDSRF